MSNSAGEVPKVLQLRLEQIDVANSFQPRAESLEALAEDYAEALRDGAQFPPIDAFSDARAPYFLGDGFTRHRAHEIAGHKTILARVHAGGQREAKLYSLGANHRHGMRRNSTDKRRAIWAMLEDHEWGEWADREIARRCCVGPTLVAIVREEYDLSVRSGQMRNTQTRTVLRNGKRYKINVKPKKQQGRRPFTPEKGSDDLRAVLGAIGRNLEEAAALAEGLKDSPALVRTINAARDQLGVDAARLLGGDGPRAT